MAPILHVKTCLTGRTMERFVQIQCAQVGGPHLIRNHSRILCGFFVLCDGDSANSMLRNVSPHRSVFILVVCVPIRIAWCLATRMCYGVRDLERGLFGATVYRIRGVFNRLTLRGDQKLSFIAISFATLRPPACSRRWAVLVGQLVSLGEFFSFREADRFVCLFFTSNNLVQVFLTLSFCLYLMFATDIVLLLLAVL